MFHANAPHCLHSLEGTLSITWETEIVCDMPVVRSMMSRLQRQETGEKCTEIRFVLGFPLEVEQALKRAFPDISLQDPECHGLVTEGSRVTVASPTERGLMYGCVSLLSLCQEGVMARAIAFDAPVCAERGLKVFLPAREDIPFFRQLVDMLCYFKYNQLMIEIGGAMEYKWHPEINEGWIAYCREMGEYSGKTKEIQDHTYPWYKNAIHMENGGGSFLTQEEVRDLAAYCREHCIEIIPEVPSLGHCDYLMMGHMDIAERPEDPYADTYCPSNPESYRLLFDVLDEVIDVFHPRMINVGHDEYYTIGVCQRCRGKTGAELFAGDINKIYHYLNSKGVKTVIWGDKLLKNAVVPGAGPFGGAEAVMYHPQFHQDGEVVGVMPATWQAIDMVPEDLLILHWNWNLGQDLEDEFLDRGFNIRYGNFEGYAFPAWDRHIKKGPHGAMISNWSTLNERILQRNGVFFGIAYAYEMFWNSTYRDDQFDELRDRTLQFLYGYKYGSLIHQPAAEKLSPHPRAVELRWNTTYHVPFQWFVDGIFPEDQVYLMGHVVFYYQDGTQALCPIRYGENIGHHRVEWERKQDAALDQYIMGEHLMEMSLSTLPEREGEITWYRTLFLNPHPEKVLERVAVVPLPAHEGAIALLSQRYV